MKGLLLFLFLFPSFVVAQDTQYKYASLFTLEEYKNANDVLLVYKELEKVIELYQLQNDKLKLLTSIPAIGRVCAATIYNNANRKKIAVGFGAGRGFLQVQPQVLLYEDLLTNGKQIFQANSERSDITFLGQVENGLAITYFESKFITRLGILSPENDLWKFTEQLKIRLGMHIDFYNNSYLIGRPYRDEKENSSELLLYKDGKTTQLPSFRGISSVAFLHPNDNSKDEILIGDGWHQDYKKVAEPRLSLISFNKQTNSYDIKTIDKTTPQINVAKIKQVGRGKNSLVLTAGDLFIDSYLPKDNWKRKRLYEKKTGEMSSNFDFTILRHNKKQKLIIWDGELKELSL